MPRWVPCKRRGFIKKLKHLGFSTPEPGGRHWYMRHGSFTLSVPSNAEYSVPQLRLLLREIEQGLGIGISLERWQGL
jgi:hypothetical protein